MSPPRMSGLLATLLTTLVALGGEPALLVKPYLQPGPQAMVTATDDLRLIWMTEPSAAHFTVEYGPKDGPMKSAKVTRTDFEFPSAANKIGLRLEATQRFVRHVADLDGLPTNSEFRYVLKCEGKILAEQTAKTRATSERAVRFVMVGDLADGKAGQNIIAYGISRQKPDFLVALGDIVYPTGRSFHYFKNFWPTYVNATEPDEKKGAPLMTTLPFYAVLGNHDVAAGKLTPALPDAYSAYYFFTAPSNGPGEGVWSTPIPQTEQGAEFRRRAGTSYPALGFYSFDYGPAHFTVLDNSGGGVSDDPKVAAWVAQDLHASKQPWKFVCFHIPPFQVTVSHYGDQRQRRLAPIFEAEGVDVVFAGHVHNYQRSKPLRFLPDSATTTAKTDDTKGTDDETGPKKGAVYVNGVFTLDEEFNGTTKTHPKGVLYIVEGGGGATLYKGTIEKSLSKLPNGGKGNYAPFNARFYDEQHSFAIIDLSPKRFELRTLNEKGEVVDQFAIEK